MKNLILGISPQSGAGDIILCGNFKKVFIHVMQ